MDRMKRTAWITPIALSALLAVGCAQHSKHDASARNDIEQTNSEEHLSTPDSTLAWRHSTTALPPETRSKSEPESVTRAPSARTAPPAPIEAQPIESNTSTGASPTAPSESQPTADAAPIAIPPAPAAESSDNDANA